MTTSQTVEALKLRGIRVTVSHLRTWSAPGSPVRLPQLFPRHIIRMHGKQVEAKGGQTVVTLSIESDSEGDKPNRIDLARGEANCSPLDNYDKRRGVMIALGRACKQAGLVPLYIAEAATSEERAHEVLSHDFPEVG